MVEEGVHRLVEARILRLVDGRAARSRSGSPGMMVRLSYTSAGTGITAPVLGDELVSVVVADDHPTLRDGVARGVREHPRLELVGEASDGQSALELIRELRPAVALVDLRMPGLDGM